MRGAFLAIGIWFTILGLTYLGLIESDAIFAYYPLIIAALSGRLLAEIICSGHWKAYCELRWIVDYNITRCRGL
ncbi:MAG: hypothetical protein CML56_03990 [Rhodobacteraceae bacterium]|nr:hypothetical protein [Paracoccaceae bacterium]